jgi:YD repeat-containing protein
MAYDAETRITQVDGENTAKYAYDAEGHRIQKTVGSAVTQLVYDAAGKVIHEADGNGTYTITSIWVAN